MASKAYIWIQTTFVVIFTAPKYRLVCSMKEIAAQSFGRTCGWVNNDRIFPLCVKYPFKKCYFMVLCQSWCYLLHCMHRPIQHFWNKRCDCMTHSFCRYFKVLKVFLGRSESLLQDKSLKNNKLKQTTIRWVKFMCIQRHQFKTSIIMWVQNIISLKSEDGTFRLCAVLTVQPKIQENETCFLEGSWFYCHAVIWAYKMREQLNVTFQWD